MFSSVPMALSFTGHSGPGGHDRLFIHKHFMIATAIISSRINAYSLITSVFRPYVAHAWGSTCSALDKTDECFGWTN